MPEQPRLLEIPEQPERPPATIDPDTAERRYVFINRSQTLVRTVDIEQLIREGDPAAHPTGGVRHPVLEKLTGKR